MTTEELAVLKEDEREWKSFISYLDAKAGMVSNLNKPRTDNDFGRAAQAIEVLLERVKELREALKELLETNERYEWKAAKAKAEALLKGGQP